LINVSPLSGQQAMALAFAYPEPDKPGRGKKGKASETDGFSATRLKNAPPNPKPFSRAGFGPYPWKNRSSPAADALPLQIKWRAQTHFLIQQCSRLIMGSQKRCAITPIVSFVGKRIACLQKCLILSHPLFYIFEASLRVFPISVEHILDRIR
jgi:hypothetical protein